LNTTDIILLIIFGLAAYSGYKKGFIMEIIALVAFILAIIGGFKLLHVGMEYVSKVYDGFGTLLPFVSFLVLFVLIIVVVNIAGNAIKKIIDWTPLGVIDNLAGAIIGVLKWALLLSILIWVMTSLDINLPIFVSEDSRILPYVTGFGAMVSDFISSIFPSFKDFVETIEELFQSFSS
jgi:membrane protein required for colicin V production